MKLRVHFHGKKESFEVDAPDEFVPTGEHENMLIVDERYFDEVTSIDEDSWQSILRASEEHEAEMEEAHQRDTTASRFGIIRNVDDLNREDD